VKLRALTETEAALEAGLDRGAGDAPGFAETARLLRAAATAAGATTRPALLNQAVADAVFFGFPAAPVRKRAEATLTLLEAAGDLVQIATEAGDLIVAPPEEFVLTTSGAAVRLGGTEGDEATEQPSGHGALLRISPDPSQARPMDQILGRPSWHILAKELGLPVHAGLAELTPLLMLATRAQGMAAEVADGGVWGRLDGEGEAFGLLSDGREAVFTVDPDGSARAIARPEIASWTALGKWGLRLLSNWSFQTPIPGQLLRALALTSLPADDSLLRWVLSPEQINSLSRWAGIPEAGGTQPTADPDQETVISASADSRLLVEAPPGSGKTWTACRRVASLVDNGLSPARIWMISFTRVAVAELRSRIAGLLREPTAARDIRIVTIDSLAWRLRAGFGDPDSGLPGGHDAGIEQTLSLLDKGDVSLLDFVEGIEHLVLDEAQDLTGDRSALVALLVSRLSAGCGVTVFHDPAQAIYGFSSSGDRPSVTEMLDKLSGPAFSHILLRTDHRTRNAGLSGLFASMRSVVTEPGRQQIDRYDSVREAIEDAADTVPAVSTATTALATAGSLVLFRSRAAMLAASAAHWVAGREIRVRYTGREEVVQPWVGALLGPCRSDHLDREGFDDLWQQLTPPPLLPREAAWVMLRRIAPAGKSGLDLVRLAQRLANSPPPLDLQQSDLGGPSGPLLTTIHGAKGREADEVHLMLPRRPDAEAAIDWGEEARTLFVGTTRARSRLVIGSAHTFLQSEKSTGRRWQSWSHGGRRDARIEIGVDGDVGIAPPVLADDGSSAVQRVVWKHSRRPVSVRAERMDGTWILRIDEGQDENCIIGSLTSLFERSIRNIAAQASGPGSWPSSRINRFHMVAARTVALPAENGGARFWLEPVVAGLPVIWLNSAN
jgi:hypothetical protein